MAGRLAWILAGGAAIVGGMAIQGSNFVDFQVGGDEVRTVSQAIEDVRAHEDVARIAEQEARREHRRVTITVDGKRAETVDPETVRALTDAVASLVKAEAALAVAEISDRPAELKVATERRDEAQRLVDQLKTEVQEQAESERAQSDAERQAVRDRIRTEIREAIRN